MQVLGTSWLAQVDTCWQTMMNVAVSLDVTKPSPPQNAMSTEYSSQRGVQLEGTPNTSAAVPPRSLPQGPYPDTCLGCTSSGFSAWLPGTSKHTLLPGHGMQKGYRPYPGCGAGAGATAGTGAGAGAGTGGTTGAGAGAGRMSGGGGGESTRVRKTSFTAVGVGVAFGGGGLRAGGGGLCGGGGLQAGGAAVRIMTIRLKRKAEKGALSSATH